MLIQLKVGRSEKELGERTFRETGGKVGKCLLHPRHQEETAFWEREISQQCQVLQRSSY